MSTNKMPWLAGRRALVAGSGATVDAVTAALLAAGATVRRAPSDLVEAADIAALFDAEAVDLLVHGGTPLPGDPPESLSLETWRASFSADLDGRYLFAAEFARRIIGDAGRHGAILFLMPGFRAEAGRTLAGTAHGALDNLVKSLAVEWGRDGIRVNAIAARAVEAFADATAAQRESLCNLATWFLSDHAAYMTGTVAGIDEL
ncbi:MAG: SDR family oxidoreductase [Novosphingobium sp.]|nr:SDR family oxidoreductase [Novosphingobium sp.]